MKFSGLLGDYISLNLPLASNVSVKVWNSWVLLFRGTTAFMTGICQLVAVAQDSIAILEGPQVELHLLCSCLGSCKVIHLLRTVPLNVLWSFLRAF